MFICVCLFIYLFIQESMRMNLKELGANCPEDEVVYDWACSAQVLKCLNLLRFGTIDNIKKTVKIGLWMNSNNLN